MLIIGLTGGFGSGKSTVANYFSELGAGIIDTDRIAHELVEPPSDALKTIGRHFGPSVINNDGTLNRANLRDIIFNNPKEKTWLEELLHPLIRQEIMNRIEQINAPYCIIVIPLLVETNYNEFINRVLVVDNSAQRQIEFAMKRDHLSKERVIAIINTQSSREKRRARADDVIYNDKDLADLKDQVLKLHFYYLELAKELN